MVKAIALGLEENEKNRRSQLQLLEKNCPVAGTAPGRAV